MCLKLLQMSVVVWSRKIFMGIDLVLGCI